MELLRHIQVHHLNENTKDEPQKRRIQLHYGNHAWEIIIDSKIYIKLAQLYHSWILSHSYYPKPFDVNIYRNWSLASSIMRKLRILSSFPIDPIQREENFIQDHLLECIRFFDHICVSSPTPTLNISNFIDSIQFDGQIQCIFNIECIAITSNFAFPESIHITHNFGNEITNITQLKMRNYEPIKVTTIHQEPNRSIYAFNMKVNKNKIKTQWIEIKLKCDEQLKYSFDIKICVTSIISSLNTTDKLFWDEYILKDINICVSQHDLRKYVFDQQLHELYNLYFPNDILSIIFDVYYPHYFDIYGEPFIYDTFDLNNCQSLLNKLKLHEYDGIDEAFIMTQNDAKHCNINGIGIQLSIDENYSFSPDGLDAFQIDPINLSGLWVMNDANPLFKLKQLQQGLHDCRDIGNPAVDAQLLLDTITPNNIFMLWIKWKTNKPLFTGNTQRYLIGYTQMDLDCMVQDMLQIDIENRERNRWCKQQLKQRQYHQRTSNKYLKRNYNPKYMYHRW